ncbi:DUF5684 domain-containing protein [Aquimarina hainanensis]|uniref:DUF5684 domain-containing protein n=1 Tax=Aquimarina hainanensis TaxID=1578017 RepID=A0ABW5N3C0_9FLAO
MNGTNILRYSLIFITIIALIKKIYNWVFIYILENAQYVDFIILEIIAIIFLIFLLSKSKKIEAALQINLNIILKYSLIFIILTSFLQKCCYLLFNIKNAGDAGYFQLLFNPFTSAIIFIGCLVMLIRKIRETNQPFKAFLISLLSFIVINYVLKYGNDLLFHYLNNIIHPASPSQETRGLASLMDFSMLGHPSFNIIDDVFLSPIDSIWYLFESIFYGLHFDFFVYAFLGSQCMLSMLVIFYYSSYVLFEYYNKKGVYSLIPILKDLVFLDITKKPSWWIIVLLIPFIRMIPRFFINVKLCKQHQKKKAYAYGMTFLPWLFYGMFVLDDTSMISKTGTNE